MRALFEAPTPAGLAARLEAAAGRPGWRWRAAGPRPDGCRCRSRSSGCGSSASWRARPRPTTSRWRCGWTGELDAGALEAALGDVIARHEVLRTVFPAGGRASRTSGCCELAELGWRLRDRRGRRARTLAGAVTRRGGRAVRPGRGGAGAGAAARGWRRMSTCWWWWCTTSRPTAGRWGSLARDLARGVRGAAAQGRAPGWAPLPVQYADYAMWQRELLGDEDDPGSLLAGAGGVLAGGAGRGAAGAGAARRPAAPGGGRATAGDAVPLAVPAGCTPRLAALARRAGRHAVHGGAGRAGGAAVAAGRGQTTSRSAPPVAGRTDEALDDLVGFFVNTLVLRTDVSGDPAFAELLGRVREAGWGRCDHQDVPFERLVEELARTGRWPATRCSRSCSPLQNNAARRRWSCPGVRTAARAGRDRGGPVRPGRDPAGEAPGRPGLPAGCAAQLTVAADLFDAGDGAGDRRAAACGCWRAVAADPAGPAAAGRRAGRGRAGAAARRRGTTRPGRCRRCRRCRSCSRRRRRGRRMRSRWSAGTRRSATRSWTRGRTGWPGCWPGAGRGRSRWWRWLLDRSVELVVALLAVLKAGAAYLPVDPGYPAERIAFMLADAGPVCVLTDGGTGGGTAARCGRAGAGRRRAGPGRRVAGLPGGELADGERAGRLAAGHPAYVIYTSGSTGRPKGWWSRTAGFVNLVAASAGGSGCGRGRRVLQFASAGVRRVGAGSGRWPLLAGAALVVRAAGAAAGRRAWPGSWREAGVTHALIVAERCWRAWRRRRSAEKVVLVAGVRRARRRWRRGGRRRRVLVNAYGPTETTV